MVVRGSDLAIKNEVLAIALQRSNRFATIGAVIDNFDVEIGVPFNENINEGLKLIAEKVADECPTGALGRR